MKKLLSMLLVLLLVSGCAMLPDASSSRPSASSQPSHTTGTHTTIGRPTETPTVPTVPSSIVVTEPPTVPTVPTVPATEPTEPTRPTDPTEPTEPEPEDPELPKTGQLNWPVPILTILGLSFFTAGWILCFHRRRDSHEA